MEVSNRAGFYQQQTGGYRTFIPAPLSPKPAVHLKGELQVMLSEADRALGRLDGSITTLLNPDLFVMMYVRKEAVLSSQIEGTQSSLQNLLEAEAKIFSKVIPRDVDEVTNYVKAESWTAEAKSNTRFYSTFSRNSHRSFGKCARSSCHLRGAKA